MTKTVVSLRVSEEQLDEANNQLKVYFPTKRKLAESLGIDEDLVYRFFKGHPIRINTFKDIAEAINLSWSDLTNYNKCSRTMMPYWWLFDSDVEEAIKRIIVDGNFIVVIGNYTINCLLQNDSLLQSIINKRCPTVIITQRRSHSSDIDCIASLIGKKPSIIRKDYEEFNELIDNMISRTKSMGFDKITLKRSSIVSLSWHGIFSCIKQNGKVKLDPQGASMIINLRDSFSMNECLAPPVCNKYFLDNQRKQVELIEGYIND